MLQQQTKNGSPHVVPLMASNDTAPLLPGTPDWKMKLLSDVRFYFALCVLLPTLIASIYYGLMASDQYRTEMQLSVRTANSKTSALSLLDTIIGMPSMNQSSQDARSIISYLYSHDALRELDKKLDLRTLFSDPGIDMFSRLSKNASFESFLSYYRKKIDIKYDHDSGTAIITVQAFTPESVQLIAKEILRQSEELVNSLNSRSEADTLQLSQKQLLYAEERMKETDQKITAFRMEHQDVDPSQKSGTVLGIISELEAARSKTAAELQALSTYMTKDNVSVRVLNNKLAGLEKQIKAEQARLTGQDSTYMTELNEYQNLSMEQKLAERAYTAALASLETARLDAQRQKIYVVPIVEPNQPQAAEYPRRLHAVFLVFLSTLLIFGMGKLLIAGVRDHVMH